MKKFLLSLMLLFLVNLVFVRMTCGRRTCFNPASVSLTAFDNADSVAHVPGQSGVLAKAFMLEYSFSGNTYNCGIPNLSWSNSAYAQTSFSQPVRIDSVHLTSNHDFDTQHPAGSDLKSLFWEDDYTHHAYLKNYEPIRYYLMSNPSDTGTHIFTIKFFIRDTALHSQQLIASTLPVKLLL